MKQFLSAGALLLLFAVLALSFCFVRFSVIPEQHTPITATHRAEIDGGMGKLHISLSGGLVAVAKETWSAVLEAAHSLPFFATDAAEALLSEAWLLCDAFSEALASSPPSGATEI